MSELSAPGRQKVDRVGSAPSRPLARVRQSAAAAVLIALPDRIVSVFLTAAIVVGLAVIFHVFLPIVVLPAALLVVLALWRWTPSEYLAFRHRGPWWVRFQPGGGLADQAPAALGSAAALLLALLWLVANRHHLSSYLVLQRDPGIYALRGLWLTHHSTPVMNSAQEALDAGGIPGVGISSLAFPSVGTNLYPQSNALLPGLLGVLGWFLGVRGVLAGNLLIGAVGLVALYAFSRRVLGPLWALVPMATLAACMPMIAFSRGSYSEPVALVATFGGLTLLWIAWQSGAMSHFFTAGLLIGVGSLARIDGGVTLLGVLAGFAVVTLGARDRRVRIRSALACTLWAAGAGALDALSLVDGRLNSPVYQSSEWHGIRPLLIATVLAYLCTVGLAFVPVGPLRRLLAQKRSGLSSAALGAALLVGVALISRPLWWTARTGGALSAALGAMQKGLGLPVDPLRTYDESSLSWLAMYLSWPVILLAGIGAAMMLAAVVRRRNAGLAVFAATIGSVALFYLNHVAIFPDQIWAMRRFLPVVLPGLLIAAVYPLTRIRGIRVSPARAGRLMPLLTGITALLAVGTVLGPVVVWSRSHLWSVANVQAQVAEMGHACSAVGHHPVILAGPPPGSATFLPTFRAGCGSETVVYPAPTTAGLAALRQHFTDPARGADTTEPVVVLFDPTSVTWQKARPTPYMTTYLTAWNQPLQAVPSQKSTATRSMWIGTLTTAGQVVPLTAGPTIANGP